MARKAKEEVIETKQPIETSKKTAETKKTAVKSVAKKATSTKKTTSKTTASKSTSTKKATSKTTASKSTSAKKTASKTAATKSVSTKKATSKTAATKSTSAKKATSKTTASKSTSTKKATSKTTATKSASTKNTTAKTAASKSSSTKKVTRVRKTSSKKTPKQENVLEYYDLPYRYNQTIVKVLAQNPNTLFVYWDVSDEDVENFEKQYGSDFITKTKPVLVIHNLTDNYTFEIDINDFANNWYVNVNDTKCKYFVELGRRQKNNDFINTPVNYINIAFSNTIEIPNDHILFFKENDKIYFKNIKTNKITEKAISSFKHSLQGIYKTYNLSSEENDRFDRFDFNNPSSQNPTSTLL